MWTGGWSFPKWGGPNSLQKRLIKFLLRRTVGQFLREEEINLDDLDVQLSSGCFELRNVALNEDVSVQNKLVPGILTTYILMLCAIFIYRSYRICLPECL